MGYEEPMGLDSLHERFWSKVHKTDSCWLWTAHIGRRGYGMNRPVQGETYAHRIAWALVNGPIPDGLTLDHVKERCSNKHCVNPAHLEPVTAAENHLRWQQKRTHCRNGHSIAQDGYVNAHGYRRCRVCNRQSSNRAYQKRRKLSAIRANPVLAQP